MKLIFCPHCQDVVKLQLGERTCMCGKSTGRYVDSQYAEIGGAAIPIGFENGSFVAALERQPESGLGSVFRAFVIPKSVPTVRRR